MKRIITGQQLQHLRHSEPRLKELDEWFPARRAAEFRGNLERRASEGGCQLLGSGKKVSDLEEGSPRALVMSLTASRPEMGCTSEGTASAQIGQHSSLEMKSSIASKTSKLGPDPPISVEDHLHSQPGKPQHLHRKGQEDFLGWPAQPVERGCALRSAICTKLIF